MINVRIRKSWPCENHTRSVEAFCRAPFPPTQKNWEIKPWRSGVCIYIWPSFLVECLVSSPHMYSVKIPAQITTDRPGYVHNLRGEAPKRTPGPFYLLKTKGYLLKGQGKTEAKCEPNLVFFTHSVAVIRSRLQASLHHQWLHVHQSQCWSPCRNTFEVKLDFLFP